MAQQGTQTIPRDQFLTIAINLLHKSLLEVTRTRGKQRYRELAAGRVLALSRVQMEDQSIVHFKVSLDHSEYPGRLNFGGFRNSLATLVQRLAEALDSGRDVPVFSAEHKPDAMIFGVTGVTWQADHPSVMVLGTEIHPRQPEILLKLTYLDHRQFDGLPAGNGASLQSEPG